MPQERKPRYKLLIEVVVPAENLDDAKLKIDAVCHNIGVLSRYQARTLIPRDTLQNQNLEESRDAS